MLHKSIKKQLELTLAQLVADLDTQEKAYIFLLDFLSEIELETLSKRLAVAYWLRKKRSIENITNNLNVTSSIISEVKDKLGNKGYQSALKLLEADEWANVWSERIKNATKLVRSKTEDEIKIL